MCVRGAGCRQDGATVPLSFPPPDTAPGALDPHPNPFPCLARGHDACPDVRPDATRSFPPRRQRRNVRSPGHPPAGVSRTRRARRAGPPAGGHASSPSSTAGEDGTRQEAVTRADRPGRQPNTRESQRSVTKRFHMTHSSPCARGPGDQGCGRNRATAAVDSPAPRVSGRRAETARG